MALDSTSTVADALGQYNDNLLWDGDATKARNCLEAVRWILANRASVAEHGKTRVDFLDLSNLERRLSDAVSRLATSRSTFTRGRPQL